MGRERRKFPRGKPDDGFQIACYPTEFRREGDSTRSLATKFLDLSSKGACIVTPGRLRPGVVLTVHVRHDRDRSRFKGRAVVRWAETLRRNRKEAHIAGLEFTEVLEARGERMLFLRKWAKGLGLLTPEERRRGKKRSILEKARVQISTSGVASALGLGANAWCVVDLKEDTIHAVSNRKLPAGRKVKVKLSFANLKHAIQAVGTVRYCERNLLSLEPRFPTEIELNEISEADRTRLRLIVQSFEREF